MTGTFRVFEDKSLILYSKATLKIGKFVFSNTETAFIKADGQQLPKSICM
jgi:hypothetical protein